MKHWRKIGSTLNIGSLENTLHINDKIINSFVEFLLSKCIKIYAKNKNIIFTFDISLKA